MSEDEHVLGFRSLYGMCCETFLTSLEYADRFTV